MTTFCIDWALFYSSLQGYKKNTLFVSIIWAFVDGQFLRSTFDNINSSNKNNSSNNYNNINRRGPLRIEHSNNTIFHHKHAFIIYQTSSSFVFKLCSVWAFPHINFEQGPKSTAEVTFMRLLSLSPSISTNTHSLIQFVFNRQDLVSLGFSPRSISPHGAFEQGPKTTTEVLLWACFHYNSSPIQAETSFVFKKQALAKI